MCRLALSKAQLRPSCQTLLACAAGLFVLAPGAFGLEIGHWRWFDAVKTFPLTEGTTWAKSSKTMKESCFVVHPHLEPGHLRFGGSLSRQVACWLLLSLGFLAASPALNAAARRVIAIECTPPDATALIVLEPGEKSSTKRLSFQSPPGAANGFKTEIMRLQKLDRVEITVSRQNYETFRQTMSYDELDNAVPNDKTPVVVTAKLVELVRYVPSEIVAGANATVYTNGVKVSSTVALAFSRTNSTGPWSQVDLKVERPAYKTVNRTLSLADVEGWKTVDGRRQLTLAMDQIESKKEISVTTNEKEVPIFINNDSAGSSPSKITLVFNRPDGSVPWSTNLVRLEKDGFEYRPPGTKKGVRAYETNLTLEASDSLGGTLDLQYFQPVREFDVPLRRMVVRRGEAVLETTNSVSAKDPKDELTLTRFGGDTRNEWALVGKIAAQSVNNSARPTEVVLAIPVRENRNGQPAEIVGSSLYLISTTGARRPITESEPGVFDLDPAITKDGKTVYFSSNRRGQRSIWKKPATSGGGRSPIDPGRGVDVEPAVFTPNEGNARVAFTRYFPNAALGTPPRIVVQSEDGNTFAETEPGRSPAWSNDGQRLAFVSPDHKIWVMDATGEKAQQLTTGNTVDMSPCWMPNDKFLLYSSSASAEEACNETGNFDIWQIDLEGNNPRQWTFNTSFDGFPVSQAYEGGKTFVYFLSNRGAQADGQEPWRVHYFEPR
jgi:hypothetical protein